MSGLNVFNNEQRPGYQEIASYGPRYWLDIKEMVAIYKFAGYTLDMMAADLENYLQAQFIAYMDEAAITRLEKFLGITYNPEKTLDERRIFVQATWRKSGKMSKDKISEIINSFAECSCTVELKNSEIEINMTFTGNPSNYMNDIRSLIRNSIPSHLGVLFIGLVDQEIIFTWVNTVRLDRIVYRMEFEMYHPKINMYMDGSVYLDGSDYLDKGFDLFPLSTRHHYWQKIEESFTSNMGLAFKMAADELLSGKTVTTYGSSQTEIADFGKTRHMIGVQQTETVTNHLTIRNDLYYLNGELDFTGSVHLDAYIQEEDI